MTPWESGTMIGVTREIKSKQIARLRFCPNRDCHLAVELGRPVTNCVDDEIKELLKGRLPHIVGI